MKAISIRQPWAWLIVHGPKAIENRTWYCHYRGRILIHAAKGMTQREYAYACGFAYRQRVIVPAKEHLQFGGVIGMADVTDCVEASDNPWFMGDYGIVLANRRAVPFLPAKGALGIFDIPYPVGSVTAMPGDVRQMGLFE